MSLLSFFRGLALLRHPEVVRDLGERRFHLHRITEISKRFPNCKVDPDLLLSGYSLDLVTLSEGVTLSAGSVLAFGDDLNGFGRISVGRNTWVGPYNNLRAGGGDIEIGADCLISQFCNLVASNHGMERGSPIRLQPPQPDSCGVRVGDDVWLGAGVTLLPGVTIGNGAIIGAGSVVTKSVPDNEIWVGAPARRHGSRTEQSTNKQGRNSNAEITSPGSTGAIDSLQHP